MKTVLVAETTRRFIIQISFIGNNVLNANFSELKHYRKDNLMPGRLFTTQYVECVVYQTEIFAEQIT